jgi:hypothetical protein
MRVAKHYGVPFALHKRSGFVVAPGEVQRGLACDCICPACEGELVARQGAVMPWHFAHLSKRECLDGWNLAIAAFAKQLVMRGIAIEPLPLLVEVAARDAFGHLHRQKILARTSLKLEIEASQVPGEVGHRSELHVVTTDGAVVLEFSGTGGVDEKRLADLSRMGLPVLLVDLSGLPDFPTVEALASAIKSKSRWVSHSQMATATAEAKAKLEQVLTDRAKEYERLVAMQTESAEPAAEISGRHAEQSHSADVSPASHFSHDLRWRASRPSADELAEFSVKLNSRERLIIDALSSALPSRGAMAKLDEYEFVKKFSAEHTYEQSEVVRLLRLASFVL